MMGRFGPFLILSLSCLCGAGSSSAQEPVAAGAAAAMVAGSLPAPTPVPGTDDADIPPEVRDVMRRAQTRYLEGSALLKSGEAARARDAFNAAVDMILESGRDLTSTSVLNLFFQDLIRRIQTDESRYLAPRETIEDAPESAAVDELEKVDLIPISVEPSLVEVVEADIANTSYDIPITLNERVFKSLNYWLTKGRKVFTEGLVRSGRYREMIERIFREESIPLDVMYLAQVESLFKVHALSRARARGIWQFGRATAIRYGLRVDGYIDERSDPEKSTRAAARYLRDLYAMFGDWNLVMAAYNWGEGKVLRLINRSGIRNFWELTELRRNFPAETKNHVPLITSSIILARNPTHYGLPTDLEGPARFDKVPVSKPIDLRAAAKLLQIGFEDLKALNPALRTTATPPGYPDFELKVPVGTDPDILLKIAALPAVRVRPQAEFGSRHKVMPGETLSAIARRYGVSVAALRDANGIASPKSLRAGTWISVPPSRSRTGRAIRTTATAPKLKPAAQAGSKTATRIPSRIGPSTAPAPKASPARKPPSSTGSPERKKPEKTVASR